MIPNLVVVHTTFCCIIDIEGYLFLFITGAFLSIFHYFTCIIVLSDSTSQ